MPWETWPLLAITVLCISVIIWSWWGFHSQAHPTESANLRLTVIGGGYLEVPYRSGCPSGRHRIRRGRFA
ncbi:hypothetical protein GPX89_38145 [Nocardia sp. ET3-3]|uniref:Uncharacterized protein n=1 Tax=Nocardia terrae TaxID=2675851 RepID=A0A7K1V923_9NOCA|nr:hypothetical protein [Nocardia terrae]MVU83047.1 hypothetical protein [Nocardia terrae]